MQPSCAPYRHITYTSAEVHLCGDMAFDRGTFAFSVAPRTGGPSEVNVGKYFWLYERSAETWKLKRIIVCLDERSDASGEETRPQLATVGQDAIK